MEDRQLSSSDFQQLLDAVMPRVKRLVLAVKSQGYMPPFKLLITDADDDVLLQLGANRNGTVRDFSADAPLKARVPLTISLSDKAGHVWSWKFDKPGRSCIQ
jgi:hypothetical protein